MKPDEQLFSLMAVAEEQQRLVTRQIERQDASILEFDQVQKQLIRDLKDSHTKAQREFESNLCDLNDKLSHKVRWSQILLTLVFCLFLSVAISVGMNVYLNEVTQDIHEARAIREQLENYQADLSTCTRNGKDYVCVRVMKSWGAYGDDGDYFILDPL